MHDPHVRQEPAGRQRTSGRPGRIVVDHDHLNWPQRLLEQALDRSRASGRVREGHDYGCDRCAHADRQVCRDTLAGCPVDPIRRVDATIGSHAK